MRYLRFVYPVALTAMVLFATACGDAASGDCTSNAECDDGNVCNGAEICTDGACEAGTAPAEGSGCTLAGVDPGVCVSGVCHADEAGCSSDADCLDGNDCNGIETCDTATHACLGGDPADDGDGCGSGAEVRFCTDGTCLPSTCGDGYLDATTEECDDANTDPDDGCKADCTFSCVTASDCMDNPCLTGASCLPDHTCDWGVPVADGIDCDAGLSCQAGVCKAITCGNGIVETGEDCDDQNADDADGCKADCTFTCVTAADCEDGNLCTFEACDADHRCQPDGVKECAPQLCHDVSCLPGSGSCDYVEQDADGDGYLCTADCDDNDPSSPRNYWCDGDGDGYAATDAQMKTSCNVPNPNANCAGWTQQDPMSQADCDDEDPARHPTASFHDAPAGTYCTNWMTIGGKPTCVQMEDDWDWDCDGSETQRWTATDVVAGMCGLECNGAAGWTGSTVPDCGESAELTRCDLIGFPATCGRITEVGTQECR